MSKEMPDWLEDMRRDGEEARKSASRQGSSTKWSLYGQEAIVDKGGENFVRILPHASYKDKFIKDGKGKLVPNPKWKSRSPYLKVREHWWDSDGKRNHAWCAKSLDENEACYYCEQADSLIKSKDKASKDLGYKLRAKLVYMMTAVVGKLGDRRKKDGKADIRILTVPNTLFFQISDIMTGGANPEMGRGLIDDPVRGYDLRFRRPAENEKGGKWEVRESPQPCKLYGEREADAFKGWPERIPDLREAFENELDSYEEAEIRFNGGEDDPAAPGPDDETPEEAEEPTSGAADSDDPFLAGESEESEDASESGGDDELADWFGSDEPEPEPKRETKKAPSGGKKTPPPRGGRR